MFDRARFRSRCALTVGLILLAAACSSSPSATGQNSPPPYVITSPAKFLGPLVSAQESATQSLGRDGGMTVPLPNGKVLWIFGDTPTYNFDNGAWNLTGFIQGSSAGIANYTQGAAPLAPLDELAVGAPSGPGTKATQFLVPPSVYLPDGSGRVCNKANAGPQAGAVRWASGAALMPDKTNVFVPYIDACVLTATKHQAEGWGFAMYNWRTNRFSVPPTDVFVPQRDGKALTTAQYFGSPIISGKKITMFSSTCCDAGSSVYTTTVDANIAALKNKKSYFPRPILGAPATFMLSVAKPSPSQPQLLMYELSGNDGQYRIFVANNPIGPWAERAEGKLPKCDASPQPCNNSIYLHPEFSGSKNLVVSYWLPGYGPADQTHQDSTDQIWHIVLASLPF
jgi:hypothetical protein